MFTKEIRIPEPEEVKETMPATPAQAKLKAERDKEIEDVLAGRDNRLIVIVGPCSAHEMKPV
ncbi:MAG: 3-deoxy-7-phosphoheptulonate synthase, partial [Clostridia bacterium]|nr:3-deoxy-7-phosphoheptulonate synthase [Clostridia bacterium]